MATFEEKRDHIRRLANKLFRLSVNRGREYRALTQLESYLTAPGFSGMNHRELIEDAYKVHCLPSPYQTDGWKLD